MLIPAQIFFIPLLFLVWVSLIILLKSNLHFPQSPTNDLNVLGRKSTNLDNPNCSFENVANRKKIKYQIHVPKFMLELYEKNKISKASLGAPDIVRSLIPKHAASIYNNQVVEELFDNHLLIFDLPSSNEEETFIRAELKVLTLVTISGAEGLLKISIFDESRKEFTILEKIHIYHSNNTWLSFDVTKSVAQILENAPKGDKFLKIMISIDALLSNLKLSLMPANLNNFEHSYPILLLSYTITTQNKPKKLGNPQRNNFSRVKRNLEEDYEEETNQIWSDEPSKRIHIKKLKRTRNTCRRKPLYINFSEIDYDLWIVQPTGYEAYQCQGKCFYPVAEHLNPTKHAIVQALLHSVAPSKATRSCCVPTALDSISILYVDDKGVLTYRYAYKDMVVLECGCR